ncbi:hypothetical protein KM759_gp036 [Lymphocystis disease virus 4]|uniref:Uncharacterized protein n=1 Tax=Lymphocystis disease virus 4 TaxID=2704413 RepID=A0A6B9XM21_9VIRU|nr:hypothetical protein KM759_gp036 [Lymphocystis disease virus 4]QHR78457.1 hypothetical protein [Lymphocystis disease virus 4]
MNLSTLIMLKHEEGCLKSFFIKKGYKIKEIVNSPELTVIAIDYIEKAVKSFKSKWAKEARGRVYALFQGKIYILKPNILKGFELPELAFDDLDPDNDYLRVAQKFKEGGILEDSYISEKIDGCLLTVSVHVKGTIECDLMFKIMKNVWFVETDKFLFVPASRSTLFLSNDMKQYFLQSFSGCIKKDVECGWKEHKETFLKLVLEIYSKCILNKTEPTSLIFESVCENRGFKNELTVCYDFNRLIYLGYCTETTYVPHYKTDQSIVQPDWYNVNTVKEVKDILNGLNVNLMYENKIYPEGFVYMDHVGHESLPFCCKLKPSLYYKCHKLKPEYVTELLALNDSYDNIYPLVKELKFVLSDKLDCALEAYRKELKTYLEPLLNHTVSRDPIKALFASHKNLNFSFFFNHFPVCKTKKEIFSFSRSMAIGVESKEFFKTKFMF